MEALATILMFFQIIFMIVAGAYFYDSIKNQRTGKSGLKVDSDRELKRLKQLRSIRLSEPLTERARPKNLDEIVGQEQGIKSLRAALCSENPQHVIIYGPPGVGKTAAARLILEEAKKSPFSPFTENSKFIEIDATTLRFDERSIADPLIGSVHDPIYQGAGAFGPAGVPQPKEGAVTKAHGGVLFIDEIGELNSIQMNKLLKVLEDRKVFFTSSYYSKDNDAIPKYIHDIFANGLPADFRLVGATTRNPEEIPPALRSRCTEIFFDDLNRDEICRISNIALEKTGAVFDKELSYKVAEYAQNGRDCTNIIQSAASIAFLENRRKITFSDIEWVAEAGRYSVRTYKKMSGKNRVGVVNGLAVTGFGGSVLEIEAKLKPSRHRGFGSLSVMGIAEEEEIKTSSGYIKRKSSARASVENVIEEIERSTGKNMKDYDIYINFPGGMPVDGPSAGIAIYCCVYSALFNIEIPDKIALTGEISITGNVLPVGGVPAKIQGAVNAGVERIIIPSSNWQTTFSHTKAEVIAVSTTDEVLSIVFGQKHQLVI